MSQPSDFGGADSSAASTLIRLNTFDKCKRRFGNVRKTALETVIERRLRWRINPERKTAVLLPLRRQRSSDSIELDEIERQVVQRGTKLIQHFSSHDRDAIGRSFPDVRCSLALRVRDDLVRLTASVS